MPSLQRAGERQPSISNALEIEEVCPFQISKFDIFFLILAKK